ncbi:Oidioi.mRNA.OKI2018_I69.chr1.g1364.t1.cds [Oikopleura dioica]|uniref:Oidioi.mRNA.OKI2018_I69.chr1.g1364.t1.cds n=1 Tax=Oikopleura dioica TaxID=34765 RepID=A0ABN7SMN9_OIKDI|nr:Oidioi.mRNA.OKI2018_I69.chr1.g1364.t1.cds [Oikopleura dioica]
MINRWNLRALKGLAEEYNDKLDKYFDKIELQRNQIERLEKECRRHREEKMELRQELRRLRLQSSLSLTSFSPNCCASLSPTVRI